MFTPQNIKKLTNVSVISLKKDGMVFELALYPNKLRDYRRKLVKDINLLLHTDQIFKNVAKGELASKAELNKKFPGKTDAEIIQLIIDTGNEKLSEQTRQYELESKEKEIIRILQKKILHKDGKILTESKIKSLMSTLKINIDLRKISKVQASSIAKKILEDPNYIRVALKFEILNYDDQKMGLLKNFGYLEIVNNVITIESDKFIDFRTFCDANNINYKLVAEETENFEQIC